MGVSPVPNARVAITVQFSLSHKAVTDDDPRRLERIAPHVESALRLSLRLQANDVLRDGLANALTRLDVGVLVLDPAGFVTFANPIAIDLLGEMGTVIAKAPRFGAGNVQKIVQKEIEKRQDPQLNHDAWPPILLPDSDGMAKAAMYFLPVGASAQSNSSSFLDLSHIILIIGMHNSAPPDSALVRDILGVTLGEARVAALIGSGMAPKVAAEKLGITVETVRTVLKNVFAKVGIKKQSELTALLTRLVLR